MAIQKTDAERAAVYETAVTAMQKAYSEPAFRAAAGMFESIPGFRDADALSEKCLEDAEICRKNTLYNAAKSQKRKNTIRGYRAAAGLFGRIPGWKDADRQKSEAEKAGKKRTAVFAAAFSAAGLLITAAVLYAALISPLLRYRNAQDLFLAGRYEEARY